MSGIRKIGAVVLLIVGAGVFLGGALYLSAWAVRPDVRAEVPVHSPAELVEERASAGAPADRLQAEPRDEPRSAGGGTGGLLVWGGIFAVALIAGLKHPSVGRRILAVIPTLVVLSVVIFGMMQLQPRESPAMRAVHQEVGGDERLHPDAVAPSGSAAGERPVVERYLRWVGVYWFFGFDAADAGLLQGNFGHFQDRQPGNVPAGDRVLLTGLISVLTFLFILIVAIPVGLFCALRPYSFVDYLLRVAGFIVMCVPNFLLALLLLYVAGGGFGVEGPASGGRFAAMMRHVWAPVLVLGFSGSAVMMRVMRANLLDELRQPSVVAARARGMRPMKLLFKHPVRLALTPFLASVGGAFPQLVSGAAIVAIILGLPTVAPLMLSALLDGDMHLAGSMLMVLTFLGVLGVVVIDLLLLWLDPRARLTGGTSP